MFDAVYPITKVSVTSALPGDFQLSSTIYRFDTSTGERYLIYVTEFPAKFHTIDFCRNVQKYAHSRFSELTGTYQAGRIIGTVVSLMSALLISGRSGLVSFGFIGARMSKDTKGNMSQRLRIYRSIMKFMVSPVDFQHFEDVSTRTKLMRHFNLVDFAVGLGKKLSVAVAMVHFFNDTQQQKMTSEMV